MNPGPSGTKTSGSSHLPRPGHLSQSQRLCDYSDSDTDNEATPTTATDEMLPVLRILTCAEVAVAAITGEDDRYTPPLASTKLNS